jgi:hypothetical protein
MKKTILVFLLISSITLFAQIPQGFNYQAVVRNGSGQLLQNQNVAFRFNIMKNSATSIPVFSENQNIQTDDLGNVKLIVGQGTATVGNFPQINWASGSYFLGVEINIGSGLMAMGTNQLLSVPYVLYAQNTINNNGTIPNGTNQGDILFCNGSQWTALSPGVSGQNLFINNSNTPYWENITVSNSNCSNSNGNLSITLDWNYENGTYLATDGQYYSLSNYDFDLELYDLNFNIVVASYSNSPEEINITPTSLLDGDYIIVPSLYTTAVNSLPLNPIYFNVKLIVKKQDCFEKTIQLNNIWDTVTGGVSQNNPNAYKTAAILTKTGNLYVLKDYNTNIILAQGKMDTFMSGIKKGKTNKKVLLEIESN